jgi:ribosomal protein S18 acetylase RimI-like enzyme
VASIQKIFLSNPFSRAIVARLENEIVGLVQMRQQPKSSEQHNGELAISVLKQQQGRNIGTELLRLSISQAKQEGLRYLYLDVRKDNARAIKLYEKFGFALYGIRPSYCHVAGKYFDNHLMVLALNRDKEE